MHYELNNCKITVGLPVYNGEFFIEKKLNSILSQTFRNFELIISDNASTDLTPLICKKFLDKDDRIKYYRQEQNMGPNWNFNFILDKASSPYFIWVGVNDEISKYFLEKNYNILETKSNVVGSISKIKIKDEENNVKEDFFVKLIKNWRTLKSIGSYSISGTYKNKTRFYLKNSTCQLIYGLFRTNELKKSVVKDSFVGNDWATMLNVLKFGDFYIVEDDIMYEDIEGLSSTGITNVSRVYSHNFWGKIFLWYPFTKWYLENFQKSDFFRNIDFFIQLNFEGVISLLLDNFRLWINKISKK
jgi:glycosyltransferase involved in cell wall biosynthesis